MTVKTNGAEFNAFYNDKKYWPERIWYEEETIVVDGVELDCEFESNKFSPISMISISGGIVYGRFAIGKEPSLEAYFKQWRKEQKTEIFLVQCPKDKAKSIQAVIKLNGGKIL